MTISDWALVLVIAAAVGFLLILGLLTLLGWLGLFGRDKWD